MGTLLASPSGDPSRAEVRVARPSVRRPRLQACAGGCGAPRVRELRLYTDMELQEEARAAATPAAVARGDNRGRHTPVHSYQRDGDKHYIQIRETVRTSVSTHTNAHTHTNKHG